MPMKDYLTKDVIMYWRSNTRSITSIKLCTFKRRDVL